MSVLKITSENFQNEVMESKTPVLLDFWAEWCGPCRMVSPIVEEIAGESSDFKVGKVNVDEQPVLANQFGIEAIPTLLVISGGKAVKRSVGALPKEQILEMLK